MKMHPPMVKLSEDFFSPLINKAKEIIHPSQIILYGSFARGDPHSKSDIDIAFKFNNDRLKWIKFINWANEHFNTSRHLDLVNFSESDSSFQQIIEQEEKVLYEHK